MISKRKRRAENKINGDSKYIYKKKKKKLNQIKSPI